LNEACVICDQVNAVHTHHRKSRRHPDAEQPDNLLRVCLKCHEYIHAHPEESYERGWLIHSWDEITPLENPRHEHTGKCEICHAPIGGKKKKRLRGEERRKRTTISIRVPKDAQEDGGEIWDDLIERVGERLDREGLDGKRPPYYLIVDALNDWLIS
jgi:hypothetical protein